MTTNQEKRPGEYGYTLRQFLFNVGLFIRFPSMGATIMMALFGAMTGETAVSDSQIVAIIIGAIAYHNFAYVLNDVVDLPIDRTEPRRAQFPLVRGLIQPWQALVFTALQIILVFAVTWWLKGGWQAYTALAAALILMTIYDLWGKRCVWPPLTDLAQGAAWGSLSLWAAVLITDSISPLAWTLFAFLTLYIILINGLHGSLRDLTNDYYMEVRSTAVFLGAHPKDEKSVIIPVRLKRYAAILQAALIAVTLLPFVNNVVSYSPGIFILTLLAVIGLDIASWHYLGRAINLGGDRPQMLAVGVLHLLASFGALVALFAFRLPWWLQIVVLSMFLFPLLTHSWIRNTLKWAWRSKGQGAIAESNFPTPDPDAVKTTISQ